MKIFGLNITRAQKPVPFSTVMQNTNSRAAITDATSQACIDLICSTIATMPLDLYSRSNREKQTEHYLHRVIRNPNADETRSIFFYNLVKDILYGNAFIYKYYNEDGEIAALFRLSPGEVQVHRDSLNRKYFTHKDRVYDYNQILHIPSRWGYDGTKGQSIFTAAKSVFQTTSEIDEYVNNAFNNSLGKRLVVDITNAYPNATPEQVQAIKSKYISDYLGAENVGKPLIKTNKISFESLDSGLADNRATQLFENRQFQASEIAKVFGVPLSLLNGENKYGKIEELFMIFLKTGIRPIAKDIEESFEKLLPYNEREGLYFEFNYNTFVETDLMTKIDAFTKQLHSGILTINEVREMQNLNPLSGGDSPIINGGNFFILSKENIDAYMIGQKQKMMEHNPVGDDKN